MEQHVGKLMVAGRSNFSDDQKLPWVTMETSIEADRITRKFETVTPRVGFYALCSNYLWAFCAVSKKIATE